MWGSNNHFHVVAMNPSIGELSPQKLNSHYKIMFTIMVLNGIIVFNLYVCQWSRINQGLCRVIDKQLIEALL